MNFRLGSPYHLPIEQEIRRYPEVVSCRVVPAPDGDIDRIEVLLREGSSDTDFGNLLIDLLASIFGLSLSTEQISIAVMGRRRGTAKRDAESGSSFRRPRISNIVFMSNSTKGEAQVSLDLDGREGRGKAKGQLTQQQRLRLIAEATLLAVEDIAGEMNQFSLENISEVTLLDQPVVVVLVHCFRPYNKLLSGSCPVLDEDGSIDHAVVRATLSAVNRVNSKTLNASSL